MRRRFIQHEEPEPEIEVRAQHILLNVDTWLLLCGLAGLVALALGFLLVAGCTLLSVAMLSGLKAKSWQFAVLLLALGGSTVWLYQRSSWLYHVAEVNAITATTKAPGLALALPGTLLSEGSIVAGGKVYSFSDTLRRGEVLAVGEDAIGSVPSSRLQRGELTLEPNVGNEMRLPRRKGVQ